MDNYNSNGSGISEDMFGFIPPNMMYPQNIFHPDGFYPKEEYERFLYNHEHDNEFHIRSDD